MTFRDALAAAIAATADNIIGLDEHDEWWRTPNELADDIIANLTDETRRAIEIGEAWQEAEAALPEGWRLAAKLRDER